MEKPYASVLGSIHKPAEGWYKRPGQRVDIEVDVFSVEGNIYSKIRHACQEQEPELSEDLRREISRRARAAVRAASALVADKVDQSTKHLIWKAVRSHQHKELQETVDGTSIRIRDVYIKDEIINIS